MLLWFCIVVSNFYSDILHYKNYSFKFNNDVPMGDEFTDIVFPDPKNFLDKWKEACF